MSVFASMYRRLTSIDLDEVFSYNTTKEVRMLDRRLGMVNWTIRAIVLAYVIGYVFIYRQGYAETEKSVGWTISFVNGTTYSQLDNIIRPWDSEDVVQPALENQAAFVSTTVYVTPGQTVGNWSDPGQVCATSADCVLDPPLSSGACVSGYCQVMAWGPLFDPEDPKTTQQYVLKTVDQFGITMRSAIEFPSLTDDDDNTLFTTIDTADTYPYMGGITTTTSVINAWSSVVGDGTAFPPNYYTIDEVLSLAGTSFQSVQFSGCTILVVFIWDCFVDSSSACYPKITFERLDTNEKRNGFSWQYTSYYRFEEGGVDMRDLYTAYGVRILMGTRGQGSIVSLSAIMLQIACGIALLWLAGAAADFLMLYVLPERKYYRTYKQERTPDFSDLRNKIAEVEGEKKKLRDSKNRFAAKIDDSDAK